MKKLPVIILVLILACAAYMALRPAGKKEIGEVVYYPKANIYYSSGTGLFYYFDSNEKGWKEVKTLNEEQKLSLGQKALIPAPPDPVWANNEQDRLFYGTGLYASRKDLREKFYEDSINSLTPKIVVQPEPLPGEKNEQAEAKPKNKIRRFFDKLFGRKKDKVEEDSSAD